MEAGNNEQIGSGDTPRPPPPPTTRHFEWLVMVFRRIMGDR